MKAPILPFIILLLLSSTFAPFSDAQSVTKPSPPAKLVVEVTEVLKWNPYGEEFQSFWNLTFTKSAEDSGSLKYNLYMGGGVGCTAVPCLISSDIFSAFGASIGSVPSRTNWYWLRSDVSGAANATSNLTIYLTANNTGVGGQESVLSCGVTVDFRVNLSQDQCGDTIAAPAGLGLLSTASPTATTFGIVDMRWFLSTNDPNTTYGEYNYWPAQGAKPSLMTNYTGAIPTSSGNGIQNFSFDVGGNGGKFPFYGKVLARDPLTHQRSDYSCTAFVDASQQYASSGCGSFSTNLADISAGDATFPFMNITETAELMGSDTSVVAYLLGAAVIMGISLMCFVFGGFVIGVLGTVLSIVLIAAFGILPTWILITLFLISVTILVIKMTPGGTNQ
jgi:hypothetical protein